MNSIERNEQAARDEEQVGLMSDQEVVEVPVEALRSDPDSHVKNKGCKDTLGGQACTLTEPERKAFYFLKQKMKVMYSSEDVKHERMLERLTYSFFSHNEAKEIIANGMKSEKWSDIGFQGKDPRTDFRGGGLEGLRQFLKFKEENEQTTREMIFMNKRGLYLGACNSISNTFWLKEFFHMGEHTHINKKEGNLAGRKAFKNFCYLLSKDSEIFDKLHELLLKEEFVLWRSATELNNGLSIMDMSQPQNLLRKKFKKDFSSFLTSFSSFEKKFKEHLPLPSEMKKTSLI